MLSQSFLFNGFQFSCACLGGFLLWVFFFLMLKSVSLDYFPLSCKMLLVGATCSGDQHPVFGIGYNDSDNVCPL